MLHGCFTPASSIGVTMNLGTFSVGLAVTDIKRSRKFCEDLGFEAFDGYGEDNRIIRF
jgi:hypothetical protein